jgi:chromosome segregation protein
MAARDRVAAARESLGDAEQTLGRIEAETAALSAVLASSVANGRKPVIDSVRVEAGFEAALGAAFGDDLDAPTDRGAPAHWLALDAEGDAPLPGAVEPLSLHVEGPRVLARRLSQTGIVSRSEGAMMQPRLRPGQRLVSREGDLWRWDGYVAAADAPHSAAQRLQSRNRLAALEPERTAGEQLVAERRANLTQEVEAARLAAEAEARAREAWRVAQRSLDEARAALSTAERESGRIAARRSAVEEAVARLTAAAAEAEATVSEARDRLATMTDPQSLSTGLARQRDKVSEDRAAFAEARAAVESLARELEIRSGRLAALAVERQTWHERAANAEAQIATLSHRRREAEAEKRKLAEEPAQIEARRQALLTEIANAERVRAAAADRLAAGETALAEADKAARFALESLSEAREQRGRAEERVVAAKARLGEIGERIQEALDCAPEEALAIAALKPGAALPDHDEIEARLERYRQERERLGAVNLRAEAEANEVAQRRDQLVGERDDLVAAIQRLRQGISSLNREGRERLLAAFETVNGHFKQIFTTLFGGGVAELQLTESEDPLEAGLEIMARPPGKKPQIMTLLSGGEQALTALALIFAVFLTNPAPICVLDEVDAPLDDANVERFCNLLEEMTRQTDTRFIAITHNPITMSRMNRLFGVTMAERGVSQLVSVDLETAERFREAV